MVRQNIMRYFNKIKMFSESERRSGMSIKGRIYEERDNNVEINNNIVEKSEKSGLRIKSKRLRDRKDIDIGKVDRIEILLKEEA